MKNNGHEPKPTLPPGLVPYKGTKKEIEKLRKFWENEPDNLASRGPNVRFRQTTKK